VKLKKVNIVLDCPDAQALAEFYIRLLGWKISRPYSDGWMAIASPTGQIIAFQDVEDFEPPVWPWRTDKQAQMFHLDVVVEDLEAGVEHAMRCGALMAATQYYTSSVTLIDPAGHPFCIDTEVCPQASE